MFSWVYPIEYPQVNFEFVQKAIYRNDEYFVVNTLPFSQQSCLIQNTINASEEESTINHMLTDIHIPDKKIIIYGRNYNDPSIKTKAQQFTQLGIREVYIYTGGMFEWMLLQDIYGEQEFPTTTKQLDILLYKPSCSKAKI